ncbi:MAG TPA: hypothetical protein VFG85_12310 [Gaiellaceae bacterium]|jgi:hypothetical protein|nr:hypothetical protein [Gaiellaceae bacterium]
MTELERSLRLLGDAVAFPEAPDVSEAVQRRLEGLRPERRRPRRRTLVLSFAVVALAIGAAMAVPPARTAILDFFGLRGATVQRVESLPTVPTEPAPGSELLLGEPLPVEDERLLVPAALGRPDAAYAAEEDYGLRLTLVYGPGDGVPRSEYTGVGILVTEFDGAIDTRYLDKMVDADTSVEQLTIGGNRALWLEGGPHFVVFRTESGDIGEDVGRLAGNTLLLEHEGTLLRIEGQIDRARAIEIAESLERD